MCHEEKLSIGQVRKIQGTENKGKAQKHEQQVFPHG